MRYSNLAERVGGMGNEAWEIHRRAWEKRDAGEPVIVLSVGEEQAARTPQPIVAAAHRALDAGFHHYAPLTGTLALRSAVAKRHARLSGYASEPEQVCVLAGAQNALYCTFQCITGQGDEVIVPEPYYATYPGVVRASGATPVFVPCDPETGFAADPAAIAAAITPRTRAILLNSPNNPTGSVATPDAVAAIAALCQKHDLWLISDEVYADFVFDGHLTSPSALPGMADRVVTISSLSKSHRMSGWRVGWLIGPPQLAGIVSDLACCMLYGISDFIQEAALTALEGDNSEIETDRKAMIAGYRRRRDLVCDALSHTPGLVLRKPDAGMFVMIDVRPTGLSDFDFAAQLLDEELVAVMTGMAFGPSAEGHLRMGLVAREEVLAEACTRIDRFARRLMGEPPSS